MGDVIGDLSSRRGRVEGMEQKGNSQAIRALVPLADMFGYATDLRSRTQGRATYTMQFSNYAEVPDAISKEIVAKATARKKLVTSENKVQTVVGAAEQTRRIMGTVVRQKVSPRQWQRRSSSALSRT